MARRDRLIEIQLRTTGQHYWAEQVERVSSRIGSALKDGAGPATLLEYFSVASALTWQREKALPLDPGLQDRMANLRSEVGGYFIPLDQPPLG